MTRIGSYTASLLAALVLLTAPHADAQVNFNAPKPKIAIVDMQVIMRESLSAKSLRKQIDAVARKEQAILAEEEKGLRARDAELQQQRALLTPEVFAQRQKELQADVSRLQRRSRNLRRTLDEAFQRTNNEIQRYLLVELRKLSDELDLNLIIPRSQIVLAVDDYDITKPALERLNKRLPSVQLKLDEEQSSKGAK